MTKNSDHTSVTPGSGNIFADLGLPDADELLFKAQIVAIIDASISSRNLTQAEAAERMDLEQTDIVKLLEGKFDAFPLERLFHFLTTDARARLTLDISPPPAHDAHETGRLRLAR